MKKILFIFIIFFSNTANSNEKIITLATVNNISITNIDLKDEMLIIRALNNFKEIDKNTLQQSAFQGLVDQAIKEIEIRNNKIEIKEAITTQALTNLKKNLMITELNLKEFLIKLKRKVRQTMLGIY